MRPIDWNNVEEATSEFEKVTPGGYIAIITAVTDEPAKEYLKMELDIIDGKFAGYFTELCNAKGFWGLTLYRSYKESALGFFKAFKNCVEACNRGYIFTPFSQMMAKRSTSGSTTKATSLPPFAIKIGRASCRERVWLRV